MAAGPEDRYRVNMTLGIGGNETILNHKENEYGEDQGH